MKPALSRAGVTAPLAEACGATINLLPEAELPWSRPRLPFSAHLLCPHRNRSRLTSAFRSEENGAFVVQERIEVWEPKQTAIIVCDMWDAHHSQNAVRRVAELAPRMNQVLENARGRGVLIIHAPSSCMGPYQDHPGRKRAQAAPKVPNLPRDIGDWCTRIPAEEKGKYPVDQTDGGEDDDPVEQVRWHERLTGMGRNPKAPWKAEYDVLKIHDEDAISDSGVEIWNLLEQRGIRNVVLTGVHLNMCVLGRPFGLRQLAKNGKNVVLLRDLTDTMYNPARPAPRHALRRHRPDDRARREVRLPDDHQRRLPGRRALSVPERPP